VRACIQAPNTHPHGRVQRLVLRIGEGRQRGHLLISFEGRLLGDGACVRVCAGVAYVCMRAAYYWAVAVAAISLSLLTREALPEKQFAAAAVEAGALSRTRAACKDMRATAHARAPEDPPKPPA